jgi:hypothetical protein
MAACVVLNMPDRGGRYLGAFCQLLLGHSALAHALGDGIAERNPVLRHEILRVQLRRNRLAVDGSFRIGEFR